MSAAVERLLAARREQGLPDTVTDPAALRRLAEALAQAARRAGGAS